MRTATFVTIVLVLILPSTYILFQIANNDFISLPKKPQKPGPPSGYKTILYWLEYLEGTDYYVGFGTKPFENCEIKTCYATADRKLIDVDEFDAVVFYAPEYKYEKHGVPQKRSSHQKYVFYNYEAPVYLHIDEKVSKNFYNWTMTYRHDSDIPSPYGEFYKKATPSKLLTPDIVKSKKKLVAWFVSKCNSLGKREKYFVELSKYLEVDVYGQCGKLKCDRNEEHKCYKLLEDNYKFYLSFESSLCEDYMTEKLYNVLQYNVVPIVYGLGDYDKYTPPHSVINALKYEPKELAKLLKLLNKDVKAYMKFFEWKKDYYIGTRSTYNFKFCDLCKKLHENITETAYSDITRWWNGAEHPKCDNSRYND